MSGQVRAAQRARQPRRVVHPVPDRVAVGHAVVRDGLQRVRQRVPEVQERPLAALGQVTGDDARLHGDRVGQRALQQGTTGAELRGQHTIQQGGVADQAVLERLGGALAEHRAGQGVQGIGVAPHGARWPERPHQVLPLGEVHAGLAAHRRVHHAQQRGRQRVERHAAQVTGRREARQIGRRAAPQPHDRAVAGNVRARQPGQHAREDLQRLAVVPRRHGDRHDGLQRRLHPRHEPGGQVSRVNQGDVPFGDPQRIQQSRAHLYRVRLRAADLNPTHATPRRPPRPACDRAPHDPGPRRAARPPTTTAGR